MRFRNSAIPDIDSLSNKELQGISTMLAAMVGSMDPESVAYGAYAISTLDANAAKASQRLETALLKQYRANLIEWMEHALMKRAVVGGGGPTIKKIEKGLAAFVESMPKALARGSAPALDKFIPPSGYLEAARLQPVADKIFNTIATAAQAAGVGAPTTGGTPIPFDLVWNNNRWELPSDKRTYGYRNDLKRMGFHWDRDSKQWYLPRINRNGLPAEVAQRFQNTTLEGAGLSMPEWYFDVWLPANIDRFSKVFTDYARNKQSSYKFIFSVSGNTVKVKFKRKINNARDAVEELRYRYTNRSGREPWLEVMDRFIDLVGTTSPNKIRTLIDRINNLQHSNGLFMEHFPAGIRSWHEKFLNAKYSAPTGGHLSRYIPDSDLRDYLTHMTVYGLEGGFGRNPSLEQRNLRYQPPGSYHLMKKLLEEEEDKINWRARGYPKYKGTVQIDRFAPAVQTGLGALESLAQHRERLLDLRITTPEGYQDWVAQVQRLEEQQQKATKDLQDALESQDRAESRKDPLWWVNEKDRAHARAMELTKWMQINFPQEFIEKFPYSVPGVSKSKLAPFVSRYASPERVAKKWKKLPPGWTDKSVEKFWKTLGEGTPEHKVWNCIEKMTDNIGNPEAFCGGLADWQMPGWRQKNKKESPDARSDAKSYWKGKIKKKKKAAQAQRVALRFAARLSPPMEMGSAALLKRQGLTPVDVFFGTTRPHKRPIIEFMDGLQDRKGKFHFFVGVDERGSAILATSESEAKRLKRKLIEDRKHHSTAKRVATRYRIARMSSKIRKAIEKWYAKEKYTSGLYPGSYKLKWNRRSHPDALEKRFNKMYRDLKDREQQQHFASTVLDYYQNPSWARGYEILSQAWEDTDRYFNEPVEDPDPYEDEDY